VCAAAATTQTGPSRTAPKQLLALCKYDGVAVEAGRINRRKQEELVTLKCGPRKERKAIMPVHRTPTIRG